MSLIKQLFLQFLEKEKSIAIESFFISANMNYF